MPQSGNLKFDLLSFGIQKILNQLLYSIRYHPRLMKTPKTYIEEYIRIEKTSYKVDKKNQRLYLAKFSHAIFLFSDLAFKCFSGLRILLEFSLEFNSRYVSRLRSSENAFRVLPLIKPVSKRQHNKQLGIVLVFTHPMHRIVAR